MASPNIEEIVVTTLRNRSRKLADNASKNNALLYRLRKKGNIRLFSGGQNILQELEYNENSTFKRYSGYDELNIQQSDVLSAAEFQIRQAAVAVVISGLEKLQNSGKEQMIDLLQARILNAEKTLVNNVALDCYSDGTADGGKQIGGLQHLISTTPSTGTVGGINRANFSFWRNIAFDCSSDGGAAMSSSNAQSYMNRTWVQTVCGPYKPDLIAADNNYWRFYLESLQAIQRVGSDEMAQAGFMSLKYMTADFVFDGGIGGGCGDNKMYFINTDFLYFKVHRDCNFTVLDPTRFSTKQDAMVKLLGFAGNLTASGLRYQAVITA